MKKGKTFEIVVSVFLAICLWMYVVTTVTPNDSITISDIPLVFQGESELRSEHELIVSNKSTSTVTVKFYGSRSALRQFNANKRDIVAFVDVSDFDKEREYSTSFELDLPSSLQDKDVSVVDRTPTTVQFTVEKLATKQVPVRGVFDGTLAKNYVQGDLQFDQDVVKVSGPMALVEKVSYAQVVVGGDNLTQTLTKTVSLTLVGADGSTLRSKDLATSSQEIEVTVPVYLEKTLPLTLSPIYAAGATGENTSIEISPAELTVRGPRTLLEDMTELSLGEFDLSKAQNGEAVLVDIVLPDEVLFAGEVVQAAVTATFDGLELLPVTVTRLETANLGEGMTATITDRELPVTLRGPSDALVEFEDSVLLAVADLSGYSESGSFTVPVTIQTGSETIGAVGEYTVTVKLTAED